MDKTSSMADLELQRKENALLNRYLMVGWGIIAGILMVTYAVEVVKHAFTLKYYIAFLCATLIPFGICLGIRAQRPDLGILRYWILAGYYVMYGFVLLTGHTLLVFTYVLPLLCLVILYHDPQLILQMGITALILNILMILRDIDLGRVTVLNSRDYEIQIALIILCFGGCYLATYVYGRISELNKQREKDVLRLEQERIVLEERNRYALLDGLTSLGNRRKYDEDIGKLGDVLPEDLCIAIVDINNLKMVNDTMGHLAGDELIMGVANTIRTEFEGCDCYRLGGDEFIITCRCQQEEFQAKVKAFRNSVSLWRGIHSPSLSAAIGYSCAQTSKSATARELMHEADVAMYEDKQRYYASQSKKHS